MPVTYADFNVNNRSHSLPIEDLFKFYGSFSNIGNYKFDSFIGSATGQFSGAGSWEKVSARQNIPNSVTFYYSVNQYHSGVSLAILEDDYQFRWDGTLYRFTKNGSDLYVDECPTSGGGDFTVSCDLIGFNDVDYWRTFSIWINDHLLFSFVDYSAIAHPVIDVSFLKHTGVVVYTNIRIPELCQTSEYGSIDPGEFPYSGLSRAIEGRSIDFFVRYDGTLYAFKKKAVLSSWEFDDPFQFATSTNIAELATHVRMVGAYVWADAISSGLIRSYGHRFREENNPMLFTEAECLASAKRFLLESESTTFSAEASVDHQLFLERYDRVSFAAGDYSVVRQSATYKLGEGANSNLGLIKYVWGTP